MTQVGVISAKSGQGMLPKRSRERIGPQRGATMVEYSLIVAVITILAILPLAGVGARTSRTFKDVSKSLVVFGVGGDTGEK